MEGARRSPESAPDPVGRRGVATVEEGREQVGDEARLAKRFTETVGEAPMSYLTGWRLSLAADRFLDPGTTLDAVAREVGYGSGFALSAAFTRERGISPTRHRTAHAPPRSPKVTAASRDRAWSEGRDR